FERNPQEVSPFLERNKGVYDRINECMPIDLNIVLNGLLQKIPLPLSRGRRTVPVLPTIL
ncbi:hypothetical protein, partial [Bacteroides sp.]|uniref:hypothetical protein n=1 Tax=Bacteroides sp. TaxID=29523 RepID=UPI003AB8FC15